MSDIPPDISFDILSDVPLGVSPPSNLTHSSCEILEQCPIHFFMQFRLRLPQEIPKIDYGLVGSIVHRIIKKFFENLRGVDLRKIVDPRSFFREALRKSKGRIKSQQILIDVSTCLENFLDFMVDRYIVLAMQGRLDAFMPIDTEVEYKTEINGVPFEGRVDAIFRDETTIIADWKTSKSADITEYQLKQGARYLLLCNLAGHIKENDFYIFNLRYPIDLSSSRITIEDARIDAERQNIPKLWDIGCGTYFEKRPSYDNCIFCNYKKQCMMFPSSVDLKRDWVLDLNW